MTQGIRVSLPGYDVTGAPMEKLAVDSELDPLKMRLDARTSPFGRLRVRFTSNPYTPNYSKLLLSLDYDFDYVPLWYFYFNARTSDGLVDAEYGKLFGMDVSHDRYFEAIRTGKNISFYFKCGPFVIPANVGSAPNLTDLVYDFQYSIFSNEGI